MLSARDGMNELAYRIADHGFRGVERRVSEAALAGRREGAPEWLTRTVADPTQPAVARARAFGHLAAFLSRVVSGGNSGEAADHQQRPAA